MDTNPTNKTTTQSRARLSQDALIHHPNRPMEDELHDKIENLKTDETELAEMLERYDLDEALETEFNNLDAQFRRLEVIYQSLLNARRFLSNG